MAGAEITEAINSEIEERQELAVGHKMKKQKVNGQDYWSCPKCGFSTELESQVKEHEEQPI